MATPGPAPSARTQGRSDVADWIEVEDKPFAGGLEQKCPIIDAHGSTLRWWEAIRVMPHAVLWTETDWIFAEDTALLKEKFYNGELTDTAASEMRRREDQMGTTVEARRKIRIRYVAPKVKAVTTTPETATTPTPGVTNIASRRDRLAGG